MEWIVSKGWGDLSTLEEKSVEEIQRPARSDWKVTYSDKAAYNQSNGHAVIIIKLAGDEITSYVRTIDIPEAWIRAESKEDSRRQPFTIVSMLAFLSLFSCAIITFFRKHSGRKFCLKAALPWVAIAVVANMAVSLLWIDQALAAFQTTMGWWMQIGMLLVGLGIGSSFIGVMVFLAAQALHAERPLANASVKHDFLTGGVAALALMGLHSLRELLIPSAAFPGVYSADFATLIPWLTVILNGLKGVFPALMLLILALGLVRFTSTGWRWALVILLGLIWWIGGALAAREFAVTLGAQLITLLQLLLVIELIRRQQMGVAIAVFGVSIALRQLGVMEAIYPYAWLHGAVSVVCCLVLAYLLLKHWYRQAIQ